MEDLLEEKWDYFVLLTLSSVRHTAGGGWGGVEANPDTSVMLRRARRGRSDSRHTQVRGK